MTLISCIVSKKGIWQCSDRALTFENGKREVNAQKIIKYSYLNATVALIGYSGIGKYYREISKWLEEILLSSPGPINETLEFITELANKKIVGKYDGAHEFTISIFENDLPIFFPFQKTSDHISIKIKLSLMRMVSSFTSQVVDL